MFRRIRTLLEMIRFSHTVFALPFALLSATLAWRAKERFDGLELRSFSWHVAPLTVERVESSFFEDRALFPPGSVRFDCALLMRGIGHEWHGRGSLSAKAATVRSCA